MCISVNILRTRDTGGYRGIQGDTGGYRGWASDDYSYILRDSTEVKGIRPPINELINVFLYNGEVLNLFLARHSNIRDSLSI